MKQHYDIISRSLTKHTHNCETVQKTSRVTSATVLKSSAAINYNSRCLMKNPLEAKTCFNPMTFLISLVSVEPSIPERKLSDQMNHFYYLDVH